MSLAGSSDRQDLIQNRLWITLIALGLAGLSVAAYELKRKGRLNINVLELFANTKERSEV